jgi:hypothetical protein
MYLFLGHSVYVTQETFEKLQHEYQPYFYSPSTLSEISKKRRFIEVMVL